MRSFDVKKTGPVIEFRFGKYEDNPAFIICSSDQGFIRDWGSLTDIAWENKIGNTALVCEEYIKLVMGMTKRFGQIKQLLESPNKYKPDEKDPSC